MPNLDGRQWHFMTPSTPRLRDQTVSGHTMQGHPLRRHVTLCSRQGPAAQGQGPDLLLCCSRPVYAHTDSGAGADARTSGARVGPRGTETADSATCKRRVWTTFISQSEARVHRIAMHTMALHMPAKSCALKVFSRSSSKLRSDEPPAVCGGHMDEPTRTRVDDWQSDPDTRAHPILTSGPSASPGGA
jgi:hypothetical protein